MALAWLPATLFRFSPWATPGAVLVVALLALILGAAGWAGHAGLHALRLPLWLVLPVVWTAGEWVRAHAPGTLAFPWLGLGVSLAPWPEWAGVAELVGERGVGFWMALTGGLVATGLAGSSSEGRRRLGPWVAAVVVALLPGLWGLWRAGTLETRVVARVAVVQPDVSVAVRRDPDAGWRATRAATEKLLAEVEPGSVDLVVLPEVVIRGVVEPGAPPTPVTRPLGRMEEAVGAPVLFGAWGAGETEAARYNSAFLWAGGGTAAWRYDKRRLVPLVERVPLRLPVGWGLGEEGEYAVGGPAASLEVGGSRMGVLICYESLFEELARDYRRGGADVLVNLTNDAWFGGEPWWARTPAFAQHPAHLVLRAIETRMGAVRAANTGISLVVDPTGRTHGATPLFEPALVTADVHTTDRHTLYVRTGDLLGPLSALVALLWAGVALARSRQGRSSLDPSRR